MIPKAIKTAFLLILLFLSMNVRAQLEEFDSSPLGLPYDSLMSKMDRQYLVNEKDTLLFHMVYFYYPKEEIKTYFFFRKSDMTLLRIHIEEPHYLNGKQEYKLMDKNVALWEGELHEQEELKCYLEGDTYVEEIRDMHYKNNGHTVRIVFPLNERKMIVDVFMN